jgi:hypothetical protein
MNEGILFRLRSLRKLIERSKINGEKVDTISSMIETIENYVKYDELLNDENSDTKLLIAKNERKQGLKELRDFTKGAEKLIIIDPYFFNGSKKKLENFIENINKNIRISNLRYLTVVYDGEENVITKSYKKSLEKIARELGCTLRCISTDKFHDRIWIKDRESATLVGTSLNGIGGRLSFIIPLPNNDLSELLSYLDENELI